MTDKQTMIEAMARALMPFLYDLSGPDLHKEAAHAAYVAIEPMLQAIVQDNQLESGDNANNNCAWRPIAEAPKDGTFVLLGKDIATVWIVRNGRWVNAEDWVPLGSEMISGWWSYRNSVTQELLEGINDPTHWMPLPPPPSGSEL